MPHAPCPHLYPPRCPPGVFPGGPSLSAVPESPGAPWSRLAGYPRSPGSRLPGSALVTPEPRVTFALGPFVTLHCPLPAPLGGLAAAAGGATASLSPPLSFYPPTACRLPRRPPLPPPPDTPPATLPPHHGHAWLRPRGAPRPPRSPERPPPSTARSPRSPRTPTPRRPPAMGGLISPLLPCLEFVLLYSP